MLSESQGDVLRFFHKRVVRYIALATVVSGDRFPQEILNEIRNSYTHLAKSIELSHGSEEQIKEIDRSKGHLKRVCFDCLKLSILIVAEKIDRRIADIEVIGVLPAEIYKKVEELREQRLEFMTIEAQYSSDSRIDAYNNLFSDYEQLDKQLRDQYSGSTFQAIKRKQEAAIEDLKRKQRRDLFKNVLISSAIAFIFGVLATLAARFIEF